jgi:hypothetical protein
MMNTGMDVPDPAVLGTVGVPSDAGTSAEGLWHEIREINHLLAGQVCDEPVRADLAWRRAAAWERLTILAIDAGDPPWYAAACACITEVSTEAAERIVGRRPLGLCCSGSSALSPSPVQRMRAGRGAVSAPSHWSLTHLLIRIASHTFGT